MTDQETPTMLKRGEGGAVHVVRANPHSSASKLMTLAVISASDWETALEVLRQSDEAAERERLRVEREAVAARIAAEKAAIAAQLERDREAKAAAEQAEAEEKAAAERAAVVAKRVEDLEKLERLEANRKPQAAKPTENPRQPEPESK